MERNSLASRWQPIDAYARARGLEPEEVLLKIESGVLNGALLQSRWYVIGDLAELKITDPNRPHRAVLRLHGAYADGVFSAGHGCHELRLKYDREEVRAAIGRLMASTPERIPAPVDLMLAGKTLTVDCSVQGDVLGVLLEWQVEVELRNELTRYPPASVSEAL